MATKQVGWCCLLIHVLLRVTHCIKLQHKLAPLVPLPRSHAPPFIYGGVGLLNGPGRHHGSMGRPRRCQVLPLQVSHHAHVSM